MSRDIEYAVIIDGDGNVKTIKPGYRDGDIVEKTLEAAFPDAVRVNVSSPVPGYSALRRRWLFVIPFETDNSYDMLTRYVQWIDGTLDGAVWIAEQASQYTVSGPLVVTRHLHTAQKVGRKAVRRSGGGYRLRVVPYV